MVREGFLAEGANHVRDNIALFIIKCRHTLKSIFNAEFLGRLANSVLISGKRYVFAQAHQDMDLAIMCALNVY